MARHVRTSGPGLEVLVTAGTVGNLPAAMNGSRPDLLVLDGVDASGLDALARLAQMHPEIDTIVVSHEQSPAFLLKAMQAGVREVLPPPVGAAALQAAVQRLLRKRAPAAAGPSRHGEVLAFLSCKGGGGATFLAANVAHALSTREGRSVALIDLDLQFGDALLMLGDQRAGSDVAEVARNIGRLDTELLRASMVAVTPTLSVLPAPQELPAALEVKADHVEGIVRQARQMFDHVVLDLGHSIDAVSLQGLDLADCIAPVLQLSLPQLRDAKRLRALFRSLELPPHKVRWIVNRHQKTSDLTLEAVEQSLGVRGIATVPNHYPSVSAAIAQGLPIERVARGGAVARAVRELANSLAPTDAPARKDSWFGSLFGNG